MALLADSQGALVALQAHHLVGRSRAMHTRVKAPEVSAQHAALMWTVRGWVVRDLGSRNGTFVDGVRLESGAEALLKEGTVLAFGGDEHAFTLSTLSPPSATARCGERLVEGSEDMLHLPSADDPQVLLLHDPDEGWLHLHEAGSTAVSDGQQLEVAGERWTVSLPAPMQATIEARGADPFDALSLGFRVSGDEEYVEVQLHTQSGTHSLPPRAHHYLLLTLARARMEDQAQGLSEGEQGWLYTDQLAKRLGGTANQVYVSVHRARKEFERAGGVDGARLVERRPTTRQLRLGIGTLHVERI